MLSPLPGQKLNDNVSHNQSDTKNNINDVIITHELVPDLSESQIITLKSIWSECLEHEKDSSIDLKDNTRVFIINKIDKNNYIVDCIGFVCLLIIGFKDIGESFNSFFIRKIDSTKQVLLYNLCIKKQYRRNRFASTLIDNVEEWCVQNDKSDIVLDVYEDNKGALMLYEKHNFSIRTQCQSSSGVVVVLAKRFD
jgi:ribosomal protein S18 acetylase RimI-like enzyme